MRITRIYDNGDIEYRVINNTAVIVVILLINYWSLFLALVYLSIKATPFPDFNFNQLTLPERFYFLLILSSFGIIYLIALLSKQRERALIHDIISHIIQEDFPEQNLLESRITFHSMDITQSIFTPYALVHFTNQKTLRFLIKQIKRNNERYYIRLVQRTPIEDTDKTQMADTGLQYIAEKPPCTEITERRKVTASVLLVGIFTWMPTFIFKNPFYCTAPFTIILICFFILISTSHLKKVQCKGSILKAIIVSSSKLRRIASYLLRLSFLFHLIIPPILFVICFPFLLVFIAYIILYLSSFNISLNASLYIFLTLPIIIVTQFPVLTQRIILKTSNFGINDYNYQLYLLEIFNNIYKKGNLNRIIYTLYFCFLIAATFFPLQYGKPFISDDLDTVIIKSFVTFMACENITKQKKSSDENKRTR